MRAPILLATILTALSGLAAPGLADWYALEGNATAEVEISGTPDRLEISYAPSGFHLATVEVDGVPATAVSMPGRPLRRESGWPELPMVPVTLRIAGSGDPRVEIIAINEREIPVAPVLPSRGHLPRNIDPDSVPRRFGPLYARGGVWPARAAVLGRPFLAGGARGVTLRIQPLRYDAQRGVLVVTESVRLAVITEGPDGANRLEPGRPAPAEHAPLHRSLFANPADEATKAAPAVAAPRLLVVAPAAMLPAVEPFAAWKARRGIEVETVAVESLGTAAAISDAISQRYHGTDGLTWVVLVGDREQVPTLAGATDGAPSDMSYGMVAGDDLYPDVFVSRLPARDADEAAVQVARCVSYERDAQVGAAWHGRASGVASSQGDPADHERLETLRSDLLGHGFDVVDRVYEVDGAGSVDIAAAVEAGRSLINYLGHGTGTAWNSVPFTTADVHALDNTGAWPWIVDASCDNGDFTRTECLAEAWLRAGDAAAPAGAVAVLAATSDVPWTPPTFLQAGIVEALTTGGERSLGALTGAGLGAVLDIYGGLSVAGTVVEQYALFGDASLQVRTTAPGAFDVWDVLPAAPAAEVWKVTVDGPVGSVVAYTADGVLYGRGEVPASGQVEVLPLRDPTGLAHLDVTVTGPDMVPWLGSVAVTTGLSAAPAVAAAPTARLLGNYPNPFNPSTVIAFELAAPGRVTLEIHDLAGRVVRTLVRDEMLDAGRQERRWDGRDGRGRALASGVYLTTLRADGRVATGRMSLLK